MGQKSSDKSHFPPFSSSPPSTIVLCSAFIFVDFFLLMLDCWSTVKLLATWRQLNVPEARCALSTYQYGEYVKNTQTSKKETLQKTSASLYRGCEQLQRGFSLAAEMLILLRKKVQMDPSYLNTEAEWNEENISFKVFFFLRINIKDFFGLLNKPEKVSGLC